MDSLLWALAEAEIGTTTDTTRMHFKELRYEIASCCAISSKTSRNPI